MAHDKKGSFLPKKKYTEIEFPDNASFGKILQRHTIKMPMSASSGEKAPCLER